MGKTRVAFIGTGPMTGEPGPMGYAMAHMHADGYEMLSDVEMVACADIVPENGEAFAEKYGFSDTYTDYNEMLAAVNPDLVSICTWPHLHAEMVLACAAAEVAAVHCEKPMAHTFGVAKAMVAACEESGTKLTFNHQRRYGKPFYLAKELLDDGAIGELQTIQFGTSDLYDYGSHSWDMCNYFNDERDTKWVLCGLDYSEENLIFGAHNSNHSTVVWEYENGVFGQACGGDAKGAVGCHHRLLGTEGMIEIGREGMGALRVLRAGEAWEEIDTGGDGCHGAEFVYRCLADIVDCLESGRESQMNARNALRATEQIFAVWESVRRRGMVRLPLQIEDNPLEAMVAGGELRPKPAE